MSRRLKQDWNEYPELIRQIGDLHREAKFFYEHVVLPQESTQGFAQTLYGYMHRVFAFIDTLSAYWKGTSKGNQTVRMVDFMERYFGPQREAHGVAVQIWRHTLVHTALPRFLLAASGEPLLYLIHWHESRMDGVPYGVGRVACIFLIEDLERAAKAFVVELQSSSVLQANAARFAEKLGSYPMRTGI